MNNTDLATAFASYLNTWWGSLSVAIGTYFIVAKVFWKSDDGISTQLKEDISLRLMCLKIPALTRGFYDLFVGIFDATLRVESKDDRNRSIFRRMLSFSCFIRSTLISVISCLFFFLLIYLLGVFPNLNNNEIFIKISPGSIVTLVAVALFVNAIPDYLSVIETRYILARINRSNSRYKAFYLVLDVFLTYMIFIYYVTLVVVVFGDFDTNYSAVKYLAFLLVPFIAPMALFQFSDRGLEVVAVLFFSTFMTSIWIWFFMISDFLVRKIGFLRKSLKIVKYVLPIEEFPLRSLGKVCGVILGILFGLVSLFATSTIT